MISSFRSERKSVNLKEALANILLGPKYSRRNKANYKKGMSLLLSVDTV